MSSLVKIIRRLGSRGKRIWSADLGGAPGVDRPLPADPLLSVVVPVYQVEAYLAACLESLLAGLPAAGDPGRRRRLDRPEPATSPLLRRPRPSGSGSSPAERRPGRRPQHRLREATGDLVTFVDSDDTVPPNGYGGWSGLLQRDRLGLRVGACVRQERGRTWSGTGCAQPTPSRGSRSPSTTSPTCSATSGGHQGLPAGLPRAGSASVPRRRPLRGPGADHPRLPGGPLLRRPHGRCYLWRTRADGRRSPSRSTELTTSATASRRHGRGRAADSVTGPPAKVQ